MEGQRSVMRITLLALVVAMSGCAVYGRHGRVRVGVALPAIIPIPIPIPRHEPQPDYPAPAPQPPAPQPAPAPYPAPYPPSEPMPAPRGSPGVPPAGPYPSAGGDPSDGVRTPPAQASFGSVRTLETSPYRGMVRVGVLLDNRAMRYLDLPGTNLRIGERVRLEGDRIYRAY